MAQEFPQTPESRNITPHRGTVSRSDRQEVLGQGGCVIWLTGLSGSGKSTVAHALEQRLINAGRAVYVLDGDNIRTGLCADLGFSPDDRRENIRRIGHVGALLADAGIITITAFISPYRDDRLQVRKLAGEGRFIEVFLDTPLDECQKRDPKGLYAKAKAGQLDNLTGIDAPYEPPRRAEITLDTLQINVDDCVTAIETYLEEKELIPRLRKIK